ncbi:MAG TPA: hypothetical protein VG055_28360 [Planctomycetaceae bacterium]|nr:hypothetical protein [Planctomycetaceae bacterium]
MSIDLQCVCGHRMSVSETLAGKRRNCPGCGRFIDIPEKPNSGGAAADFVAGIAPPAGRLGTALVKTPEVLPGRERSRRPSGPPADTPAMKRMLEALLDPRAIQWMLMIGGGLTVVGLVIWLVSLGIFKDPRIMAVALGCGSLAVLGAGWWVTLKTRYRVAGQALTFLGCVILPLNLWFYHAQGLITLDQHLWVGGLVCVFLYAGTVFVLRDPLFMYAVEVGVTLTVLLLMADLRLIRDAANFSLFLLALGAISIHAERAFSPEGLFSRRRFGQPLFWSGHAQVGIALLVLLGSQVVGWLTGPLGLSWSGNALTQNDLLAGGLWIAATYLYLYSDLVVRRVGVYTYLAAICLLMAEVTLVLPHVNQEGLIAALAITSLAMLILEQYLASDNEKLRRHVKMIAAVMAQLPVLLGVVLHLRATSGIAASAGFVSTTGWPFVGAMILVVLTNRIAAFLCRHTDPKLSSAYFFSSAAGALVAAAGLLRQFGWAAWYLQAPPLMLIPIGYLVAARLWRGHSPERPLLRVANAATGVILVGTFVAAMEQSSPGIFRALSGRIENLYLGLTFSEAAGFYALAAWFQRRSANAYFATIAGCGALWQFIGYFGIPDSGYPLIYAGLGIVALVTSRGLGIERIDRRSAEGEPADAFRGNGLTVFQCGNAVLSVALVAALLQGLARLPQHGGNWLDLWMLLLTTVAGLAAIAIVPASGWRRSYATASIALAGVTFLTLNLLIDLNGWQKLEIFCVTVGLVALGASHFGRFRQLSQQMEDNVSVGLWMGSLLSAAPLFVAMIYHRFVAGQPSLYNEFGLLTVTILMLVSGLSWQIKSTTLVGGLHLVLYLLILIVSIAYRPEVAVGVYLLIGGGLIFAAGVALSIYRDRLLALPDQIANREGFFRIIDWR